MAATDQGVVELIGLGDGLQIPGFPCPALVLAQQQDHLSPGVEHEQTRRVRGTLIGESAEPYGAHSRIDWVPPSVHSATSEDRSVGPTLSNRTWVWDASSADATRLSSRRRKVAFSPDWRTPSSIRKVGFVGGQQRRTRSRIAWIDDGQVAVAPFEPEEGSQRRFVVDPGQRPKRPRRRYGRLYHGRLGVDRPAGDSGQLRG